MPKNLELKASISSIAAFVRIAGRIHARRVGVLKQTDTYFVVPSGRFKLREIGSRDSELIFYVRPDKDEARYSTYHVVPVREKLAMKTALRSFFRTTAIVRKRRVLYLYKNARIHLDFVRGLGAFIEFEVPVTKGKKQAEALMKDLRDKFGIKKAVTVGGSYADLLQEHS